MTAASASRAEKHRQEEVCAAVAASVLGARFTRRDENGGIQIHDFDLVFPHAVEALEVCSFTDGAVRAQWNALDRLDEVARDLSYSWTLSLARGAIVKPVPANAEAHLRVLEARGLTRFIDAEHYELVSRGDAELIAASLGLINLGVRDALRAPSRMGEAPRVMIAGGAGGVGTSALINTVVQSVAFKRDNRLKLQRAKDARRRHIFVPVDPSAGVAWAIVRETPPLIPPRLPSSVEVAWLVGANGRVLRCEPPGCWQAVSVDQLVWDEPNRWRVS